MIGDEMCLWRVFNFLYVNKKYQEISKYTYQWISNLMYFPIKINSRDYKFLNSYFEREI